MKIIKQQVYENVMKKILERSSAAINRISGF